jgi:hypothetical protein
LDRTQGTTATHILLPHAVDRIEALGADAVAIGNGGQDLYFSTIVLDSIPWAGGRIIRAGASQGETRTHGFFYKPQADGTGILGLPVRSAAAPGWTQLFDTGASVLFLRVADHGFASLGELIARDGGADDSCVASCVDWYGNARPIFYQGRIFALMGYEIVEGELVSPQSLEEARRIHFFPQAQGQTLDVGAGGFGGSWIAFSAEEVASASCAPACLGSGWTTTPLDPPTSGAPVPRRTSAAAVATAVAAALPVLLTTMESWTAK